MAASQKKVYCIDPEFIILGPEKQEHGGLSMKLTNDGEETVRITTGLLQSFGIYAELPAARQKMILPGRVNPYPRQNMPKTPLGALPLHIQ